MKSRSRRLGRIRRFLQDKTGVSAVEYALIVVAVVALVGSGLALLTNEFQAIFDTAEAELTSAKTAVEAIGLS
ncbi:MAG: hypothetical protein OXP09_20035 [Gammaproteobacteria bacterium]|nr:hypothetical protein [Gammaproteobacteria bacterium]